MLDRYSKRVVVGIILLNVLFTISVLFIFLQTRVENGPLVICWFLFTDSDLVAMANMKINEVKVEGSESNSSPFSKIIVAVIIALAVLYTICAHYVTLVTESYPTLITSSFFSFITTELISMSRIKVNKVKYNSANQQRARDLQGYYESPGESFSGDESEDGNEHPISLCSTNKKGK